MSALKSAAACLVLFLFVTDASAQVLFHVDSTRSGLTIDAKLSTIIGSDTDSDSVGIGGTLEASINGQEIQFTQVDLIFSDSLRLNFEFGLVLGSIIAAASASAIHLELVAPGPPAAIANSDFSQADNLMALIGTLHLKGEGAIATAVPTDPQNVNMSSSMTLAGTINVEEGAYEIDLPIDFRGSFDLGGPTATIVLRGVVHARGASPIAREALETPSTVVGGVYPLPASRSARLILSLERADHIVVELYDVQGRRAALLHDALLPVGRHEISFDVSQLGNGAYVALLEGESIREAVPVFVVK